MPAQPPYARTLAGPLNGLKVVEIGGIGPAPHACMIMADLGADVIRLERPGGSPLGGGRYDFTTRGRPNAAVDLKHPEAAGVVLDLVRGADVLVEGMRPGAMERLGLGPEECWAVNPRLVYGRMTGWGQTGPWASTAGHDLTYTAVTGVVAASGQDASRPHFPMNLLGDFGGGSTYLVIGVLAALHHVAASGRGQVVDAAIVDGTAHLNAMTSGFLAAGSLKPDRGSNLLDGGSASYDLYETSDGRHLAVAALEPQFYDELVRLLALADLPPRDEAGSDEVIRQAIADKVLGETLEHWARVFDGSDACVAPVLLLSEASEHPHLKAREVFVEASGDIQPAPAPRFSLTPGAIRMPPAAGPGQHSRTALAEWGISDVDGLIERGVVRQT